MSYSLRRLIVLLTVFLARPVGAGDQPPAKPEDAHKAALIRAGYKHVPLTVGPRGDLLFYVEGKVGAENVKFLLDSGCASTVLDQAVAKRLKLKLGKEYPLTGLGKKWDGRIVAFPGLAFGTYDLRKDWNWLEGVAVDMSGFNSANPTGLFGMWLIDTWGAVVDYPARSLYLRPPLMAAWPKLTGTWTVTSWQEEEQARKLDPKTPPTITFDAHRFKMTDGEQTREYAIKLVPMGNDGVDFVLLFDPKQEGKPDAVVLAGGMIKAAGGRMTACLALDVKKVKAPPAEFAAPKGSGLVLLELKQTAPGTADEKRADPLRELLTREGYTPVPMEMLPGGRRVVTVRAGQHDLRLMVDTGAGRSLFDPTGLDKWDAERLGKVEVDGLAGRVKLEEIHLRGMKFGEYDTRRAWVVVHGVEIDLAGLNRALAELKQKPLHGVLGAQDLRNGSAVIDFGTNTLYLRTVRQTVRPQLEGKWVAVRYEADGQKGQYKPGDAAIEFKGGRVRFTTSGGTTEWGFHLQDEGDKYRVGMFDPKTDDLTDGFKYSRCGLLKMADGTLTVLIEHGRIREEPTEFAAPKGSGLLLVEYERTK